MIHPKFFRRRRARAYYHNHGRSAHRNICAARPPWRYRGWLPCRQCYRPPPMTHTSLSVLSAAVVLQPPMRLAFILSAYCALEIIFLRRSFSATISTRSRLRRPLHGFSLLGFSLLPGSFPCRLRRSRFMLAILALVPRSPPLLPRYRSELYSQPGVAPYRPKDGCTRKNPYLARHVHEAIRVQPSRLPRLR
jgi:hypothetical protein